MAFNENQQSVVDLFIAAYGRAPAQSGLDFFTGKLESREMTLKDIANYMFDTENNPEAATRYPDTGTLDDKINTVFNHVLGRAVATTEGMNFWKSKFDNPDYNMKDLVFDVLQEARHQDVDSHTLENKSTVVDYFLTHVPADEQVGKQVDTDSVTNDDTTVSNAEADINAMLVTGKSFELTTGKDEFTGTDGNDTFSGVISSLSSEKTLNTDDTIDGGKGDDTLNLDMKGNLSALTGSIKNVENINLTNNTTIARSFDAKNISDVKVYTLDSAKAINLSNLVASDIEVSAKNMQNNFSIAFDSKTDLSGSSDKMALTFDGVGAAKVLNSDGSVKTAENDVKVTMDSIEDVTLKSQNSASFIDLSGVDATKYTVTGDKDLTISKVKDGLTSIDASAMSGKLSIDTTATTAGSLKDITGGSGDDIIAVDAAGIVANGTILGGEGNDTVKLSDSVGSTIQPEMSDVENLEITGVKSNGTLTVSSKDIDGLNSIILDANSTDNGAVELVSQGSSDIAVKTVGAIDAGQGLTLDTSGTVTLDVTGKNAKSGSEEDAKGTIMAANSTNLNLNVDKYMNFTGDIVAGKATSLTIDSKGKIDTNSNNNNTDLSSLESLTITAGNKVDISDANLDKVADVTLSGTETTSAVTLGTVGTTTTDYDVSLTSTGLKAGLTTGSIASKQNVTLNLDGTTGDIVLANGNNEKITSADNSVTINAKNLTGTLDTGAIEAKSVTIDNSGALKAVTIGADDSDGTNPPDITVTDNLTYTSGLKGANVTNGVEIHTAADATATTLNLNGNIGNDKFIVKTDAASDTDVSLTIKGDLGIGTNTLTVTATSLDGTTGKTGKATIDLSGVKGVDATITGSANNDTIKGSDGDDTITGGAGADTIDGGAGNDVFAEAAANIVSGEIIKGGNGTDTLYITDNNAADLTKLDATVDNLVGEAGIEQLVVKNTEITLDEAISGTALAINTDGAVNLTMTIGMVGTTLDLSNITYAEMDASTTAGTETALTAASDSFAVTGTNAADTITASSLGDTITGGAGDDTITLGTGADTVVFSGLVSGSSTNGADTISTFQTADKYDFSQSLTTGALVNSTSSGAITLATTTALATSATSIDVATNKVYIAEVASKASIDTAAEIVTALTNGGVMDAVDFATDAHAYLVVGGADDDTTHYIYEIVNDSTDTIATGEVILVGTTTTDITNGVNGLTTSNLAFQ